MLAVVNGLNRFEIADPFELRSGGLGCSFSSAVDAAYFEWIKPALFRQLVENRFGRQSGIGGSGSAVGTCLGLVQHNIVAVDLKIFQVVRSQNGHTPSRHR